MLSWFDGHPQGIRHRPVLAFRRDDMQGLATVLVLFADGDAAQLVAMEPAPAKGNLARLTQLEARVDHSFADIALPCDSEKVNVGGAWRLRRLRHEAVVKPAVERAIVDADIFGDEATVEALPGFPLVQRQPDGARRVAHFNRIGVWLWNRQTDVKQGSTLLMRLVVLLDGGAAHDNPSRPPLFVDIR